MIAHQLVHYQRQDGNGARWDDNHKLPVVKLPLEGGDPVAWQSTISAFQGQDCNFPWLPQYININS